MQVSEVMTRHVRVCNPGDSIRECANVMVEIDAVCCRWQKNSLLVGMITDRDIAIRAVAAGKGPDTPVSEVLSKEVLYCFDDQDLEHVASSMGLGPRAQSTGPDAGRPPGWDLVPKRRRAT